MKAVGAAFLGFFLWCSMPAQGALYEFTLKGKVTFSALGSEPSVGDPVTIKYVADSKDVNPDPRIGRYAATGASMELPHITYPTLGNGLLEVFTGADHIDYECGIQHPGAPAPWLLDITIAFPDGTFQSDALPLSLPLSNALVRRFAVIPIFTELFRGNISSYTSVEVPEPQSAGLLLLLTAFAACASRRAEIRPRITKLQGGLHGTMPVSA